MVASEPAKVVRISSDDCSPTEPDRRGDHNGIDCMAGVKGVAAE